MWLSASCSPRATTTSRIWARFGGSPRQLSPSFSASGTTYQVEHFAQLQVVITVKKTTVGKKVTRKITAISVPVYPASSGRSQYISENAIPILRSEALRAQSGNIDLVSGATDTSDAFVSSLQAAILKARRA